MDVIDQPYNCSVAQCSIIPDRTVSIPVVKMSGLENGQGLREQTSRSGQPRSPVPVKPEKKIWAFSARWRLAGTGAGHSSD
jgi:hypothetical protein